MITDTINGISLHLHTEKSLFSPNHIDKGTLAMLSNVDLQGGKNGYGHQKVCVVQK